MRMSQSIKKNTARDENSTIGLSFYRSRFFRGCDGLYDAAHLLAIFTVEQFFLVRVSYFFVVIK